RQRHLPGRRLAHRPERLRVHRPPLGEVGQRRRLRGAAARGQRDGRRAGGELADVLLDVLLDDAALAAGAAHLAQVHAEFAGQPARGGAGGHHALVRAGHVALERRRPRRGGRLRGGPRLGRQGLLNAAALGGGRLLGLLLGAADDLLGAAGGGRVLAFALLLL